VQSGNYSSAIEPLLKSNFLSRNSLRKSSRQILFKGFPLIKLLKCLSNAASGRCASPPPFYRISGSFSPHLRNKRCASPFTVSAHLLHANENQTQNPNYYASLLDTKNIKMSRFFAKKR